MSLIVQLQPQLQLLPETLRATVASLYSIGMTRLANIETAPQTSAVKSAIA